MKLAEALILRADYQKRLAQLKDRIIRNAKVQEGELPAEKPEELLEEHETLCSNLEEIIGRINRTNLSAEIEGGGKLTEALAQRDVLRIRHDTYRQLAAAATPTQDRFTKSEIKFKSAIYVTLTQNKADEYAKKLRELDTKIQAANWTAELL